MAFIAGALIVKIWSVADLFESGSSLSDKAVPVYQIPNSTLFIRMAALQLFLFIYLLGFTFLEVTLMIFSITIGPKKELLTYFL